MKGSSVFKLVKRNVLVVMAFLMLSTLFTSKTLLSETDTYPRELMLLSEPETYPKEIDDHVSPILFDTSNYTLYNIEESSYDYNDRDQLVKDEEAREKFELKPDVTYSVLYRDAVILSETNTLDVKVEINLVNKVTDADGYVVILFYQTTDEDQKILDNKPRIYWHHAGDTQVRWTIKLYEDYDTGDENELELLTGFIDPDESNYLFDTANKKVYYKQPDDYATAKKSIVDPSYGYYLETTEETTGLIKHGAGKDVPGESFSEARFYVDIKNQFTFDTVTFYNGYLSVPFFYLPSYNVRYLKNSPTGNDGDVAGEIDDQINAYNETRNVVDNEALENGYKIDGYRFVGWSTVKDPSAATPDPDVEIVNFDPEDDTKNTYVVPNDKDTKNTFVRNVQMNDTVDLYAQWEPNYKVRYLKNSPTGNDGDVAGEIDDQINAYNETRNVVDNEALENGYKIDGYRFVGWSTVKDPSAATPDPDVEIVNFDPEDDTKNTYVVPDDKSNNNTFKEVVSAGEVVNLYAQWEKQVYKIHYDNGYGGEQTMESDEYYFEDLKMMSKENEFDRPGFKFIGFLYTYPSGDTDPLYLEPNDFRELLISPITGPEITLVAQWKSKSADLPTYILPVTGVE